jgi:hypothetical protein
VQQGCLVPDSPSRARLFSAAPSPFALIDSSHIVHRLVKSFERHNVYLINLAIEVARPARNSYMAFAIEKAGRPAPFY